MFKAILFFPFDLLQAGIIYCPGQLGVYLRYVWWKIWLGGLGEKVRIETGVRFNGAKHIFIGDNCHIDHSVSITAGAKENDTRIRHRINNEAFQYPVGEVHIGNNIHLAPYAMLNGIAGISLGEAASVAAFACLYSVSHHHRNPADAKDTTRYLFSNRVPDARQCLIAGPIVVAAHAGVGMHACVLPGTYVHEGARVPAGQVVRGEVM